MVSIKTFLLMGLLALSAITGNAKAQMAHTLQCFQCTPEQMHAKAAGHISYLHAPPAYVVDWYSGTVRLYASFNNMTPEWNPEFDTLEVWVEEVPAPAIVVNNIAAMRAVMPSVMATPHATLAYDGGRSAFNVVDNQHAEAAVLTWLDEQKTLKGDAAFHNLLSSVLPIMSPSFWVKVVFNDGTSAIFEFKDGDYKRVDGEAKDANGNSIPETREQFADGGIETYVFEAGDDMGLIFYERAMQFNIIIHPPSLSTSYTYVCTSVGDQITCIIQIL